MSTETMPRGMVPEFSGISQSDRFRPSRSIAGTELHGDRPSDRSHGALDGTINYKDGRWRDVGA